VANPQIENGHVAIANEIYDALCRFRIPGEERQVLDVIIRKTYGWNKKEDAISLSQFVEMTGMNKPHIVMAIKGLLLKKVIIVTKNGNAPAKVYRFNKNYDEWIALPKKVILPKTVISVTKNGKTSLPKTVPTKDTNTKTTITKAIYSSDFLLIAESYPKKSGSKKAAFNEWKRLNGTKPPVETVLQAIKKQTEWRNKAGPNDFRPEWKDLERWIKNRMWESEVEIKERTKDDLGYDL
jgi:phage replication O-like protein O